MSEYQKSMRLRTLRTICLSALLAVTVGLQAEKKPKMQTVYVFGVSMSFTDPQVYLTDVIKLDSAYVMPNGFLVNRQMYSYQLQDYVDKLGQVKQSTNSVFFDVRKDKVMKKYNRVKRRFLEAKDVTLVPLSTDDFRFTAEEFVEAEEYVEVGSNE